MTIATTDTSTTSASHQSQNKISFYETFLDNNCIYDHLRLVFWNNILYSQVDKLKLHLQQTTSQITVNSALSTTTIYVY